MWGMCTYSCKKQLRNREVKILSLFWSYKPKLTERFSIEDKLRSQPPAKNGLQ